MSVELLHEAAAAMRARAQAATPGPWEPYENIHAETAAVEVGRGGFGVVALPATGRPDYGKANIEHVATWHPAVALAVADWLEYEARCADRANTNHPGHDFGPDVHALAVARAYLGEADR
jgi:hypothetical protein